MLDRNKQTAPQLGLLKQEFCFWCWSSWWSRTYEAADNEHHVKIRRTGPMLKKSPEEEEESSSYWDEISAKEDSMLLDEFERRMSFNKKQVTLLHTLPVLRGFPICIFVCLLVPILIN